MFSPDIFLLDDPTSSLDVNITKEIMKSLDNSRWKDRTFVISTNKLTMLEHANKVIYLDQGKVILSSTVQEFKNSQIYISLTTDTDLADQKEKAKAKTQKVPKVH